MKEAREGGVKKKNKNKEVAKRNVDDHNVAVRIEIIIKETRLTSHVLV